MRLVCLNTIVLARASLVNLDSILTKSIFVERGIRMSTSNKGEQGSGSVAGRDLSDMRKPYRDLDDGLEESKLPSLDPIQLFDAWFNAVKESKSVYEPNAFSICTADVSGQPSSRMVLLKGFDNEGFRFFTHYSSQKGRNIAENPKVAMLFYWDSFNRQVRIEGCANKLSKEIAETYFEKRPLSSQIGAAISDQCSTIESRDALMKKYTDLETELNGQAPSKPETWGGYLVVPNRFEFWQGNTNRVHDRIIFRKPRNDDEKSNLPSNGWVMERLLP